MKRPHVSIAIPTYEMNDRENLFPRLLDSLWMQTYQDFDIVVTDNSDDDVIKSICDQYKTGITYYRNPHKGMAPNTNEAIRRSTGELIKILYMDDFLAHKDSLRKIIGNFKGQWLVTACTHNIIGDNFTQTIHFPSYSADIYTGHNTIGSPSVLTIKNENPLFFDETMTWLLDCDYYKRMYEKYGEPVLLKDINVVLGLHQGQVTNMLAQEIKRHELHYMLNKYHE